MIETALANRPDIRAARGRRSRGTHAAVNLAKGDRLPTQILGPQYAMDEAGVQYVGLIWVTPLPLLNSGKPLVAQREAEHHRAGVAAAQAQQRAIAQVRAAVARWNGATDLVNDTAGLSEELNKEVGNLERLFELRQTDLTRLMQARQRLIQLDNSRLDAVWAATQAQADLLLALGTPSLIHAMLNQAESDAGVAPAAGARPRRCPTPGPRRRPPPPRRPAPPPPWPRRPPARRRPSAADRSQNSGGSTGRRGRGAARNGHRRLHQRTGGPCLGPGTIAPQSSAKSKLSRCCGENRGGRISMRRGFGVRRFAGRPLSDAASTPDLRTGPRPGSPFRFLRPRAVRRAARRPPAPGRRTLPGRWPACPSAAGRHRSPGPVPRPRSPRMS